MAILYTATLSTGEALTRTSERPYAFAWAVLFEGMVEASGFSESRINAEKSAAQARNGLVGEDLVRSKSRVRSAYSYQRIVKALNKAGGEAAFTADRNRRLAMLTTEVVEAVGAPATRPRKRPSGFLRVGAVSEAIARAAEGVA